MAVEVDIQTISAGYNISKINSNFQAIDVALQDAVSRSGTAPNQMEADLDMNGNDILNVNNIDVNTLTIDGVPVVVNGGVSVDPDSLVPVGGTDGQVLTKTSGVDYETAWETLPVVHELPAAGTTGQLLAKNSDTDYDVEWIDTPESLPPGGTDGQVLTKQSGVDFDADWETPASGVPDLNLFYVEDYGAVGDGVTDDTTAFNNCVAAALPAFGAVVLGAKTYRVTSKLTYALANNEMFILRGEGEDSTSILWDCEDGGLDITYQPDSWWLRVASLPGNGLSISGISLLTNRLLAVSGTALTVHGVGLAGRPPPKTITEHLSIRGGDTAGTASWSIGILLEGTSNTFHESLTFLGSNGQRTATAVSITNGGDATSDPVDHHFSNCSFTFVDKGIVAGADVEGIHVTNSTIIGSHYGVYWPSTTAESLLSLSNSHIASDTAAVYLDNIFDSVITGNLFLTSGGSGIILLNGGYNTITGNVMRANNTSTTYGVTITQTAGWQPQWRNTITGNFFYDYDVGILAGASVTGVLAIGNQYFSCNTNYTDTAGTNNFWDAVEFSGAILRPVVSDGVALGSGTNMFSDIFLASGGTLDYNNGNARIIHNTNALIYQIAGTNAVVMGTNVLRPSANDGVFLGSTGQSFSDLFLASGGVINWANGNATLTHGGSGRLTIAGNFSRGAPVTKTGDFTLADGENWVLNNKGSACVVTLPAASSYTGREVMFTNIGGAFALTSASSNVVPKAGGAAGTAILAATDGVWATLVSDGTNWIIVQAGT